MRRIGFAPAGVLSCLLLFVAGGCQDSHRGSSSGSNWLTCEVLADCASDDAASCDGEGYCRDDSGERIAAPRSVTGDVPAGDGGPGDSESDPEDERCAWGIEQMLAEVDASASMRVDCGLRTRGMDLLEGLACLEDAMAAGDTAELTVNRCIDCTIATSYVVADDGALFALFMEEDHFGSDDLREARIERCTEIGFDEESEDVFCGEPSQLYRCMEPYAIAREDGPLDRPVTPRKLGDVPSEGAPTATLHLYVSNQSFEEPLVGIGVYLDDTQVVTGDFAVEGQHNWIQFDIEVPAGSLALRAESLFGDIGFEQTIEVPAERWGVLEYWSDGAGASFTFDLHDMPVAFQ